MSNFWADQLAPQQPAEPQAPTSMGEQYRAFQRSKSGGNGASGSAIYDQGFALPPTPEQRAAARPSIYSDEGAYQGLQQYETVKMSKWARGNESPEGYLARLRGAGLDKVDNWGVLSSEDQAAVTAELEKIQGAGEQSIEDTFQAQRKINDARSASLGGEQGQGIRVAASERFGHTRQVEREGHVARAASNLAGVRMASMADVAAARRAAEEQYIPQRSAELAAEMGAVR